VAKRNLGVGLEHASKHELQAMVESKLHEPGNTSFDDPQEWSTEEMKDFLRAVSHSLSKVVISWPKTSCRITWRSATPLEDWSSWLWLRRRCMSRRCRSTRHDASYDVCNSVNQAS